jgi:hypothetical protein
MQHTPRTLNPPTFSAQPAQLIDATFLNLVTAQSNVSCITIQKEQKSEIPNNLSFILPIVILYSHFRQQRDHLCPHKKKVFRSIP